MSKNVYTHDDTLNIVLIIIFYFKYTHTPVYHYDKVKNVYT